MGYAGFIRRHARWLAAGLLLTFASSFGQTFFISVFAGQIRAEFGLSHGAWGAIYALGTGVSAVAMLALGGMADRMRAATLGAGVLAGLAAMCLVMAGLHAVWALPVVILGLRFFGQGMATHVAAVAMGRWFTAERGRALAVAGLGFSIGEAALPIIVVAAFAVLPWRAIWVAGAAVALCTIPALRWAAKGEPLPQSASQAQGTGLGGRHWTRGQVLADPLFWLTVPLFMGMSMWGTALFFQQVHLVTVKGWAHADFAARVPAFTLSALAAMAVAGWAIDRFGSARVLPLYQLPMAAALLLLWRAETPDALWLALILFGASAGVNAALPGAFWAEFYGTRHLGSVKALAGAVMVAGSALGPGLTGAMIDAGLSFPEQMPAIAVAVLGACAAAAYGVRRARRRYT